MKTVNSTIPCQSLEICNREFQFNSVENYLNDKNTIKYEVHDKHERRNHWFGM